MKESTKEILHGLGVIGIMLLFAGALLLAQSNRKPHTCTDKCHPNNHKQTKTK